MPETCPDCTGSLVYAFPASTEYVRCTRCGHVIQTPPVIARITRAQDRACTEEFCLICGRATDHWGEHSDDQILAWADQRGVA